MKRFLLFAWASLLCLNAFSQQYATIYIEGDLQLPFYVKVEGRMQERLAKNYFLIPNLDAGYTNFELLFEQNKYPPQQFLLAVPESGLRGFSLKKVNDRQFALYDLQQKRYIVAGNKQEDDWLEKRGGALSSAVEAQPEEAQTKREDVRSQQHLFIEDIELNAQRAKNAPPERKSARLEDLPALKLAETGELVRNKPDRLPVREDLPEIPNTDCPESMTNHAFEGFALQFLDADKDDDKIKFVKARKGRLCFSTEQVRILGKNLEGQSRRFELVQLLYPQVSDQENYGRLEELFNTDFLKERFRQMLKL